MGAEHRPPGPSEGSGAILWRPGITLEPYGRGDCLPRLYWAPRSQCPTGEGVVAYCTDDKPQFVYEAFNHGRDFGPLDIARTVMYCRWVEALQDAHQGCSALVHVASDTCGEDRANTVVLCGAYLVLAHGFNAEDAFRPFASEPLPPFMDCRGGSAPGAEIADEASEEFGLTALEVLRGLERSRDLGWLDYRQFDIEEHASMLRPECGDMSWLLPGKALALASPWCSPVDQDGLPVCTPAALSPYFLQNSLRLVVQCNHPEREEEGDRKRLLNYQPQDFEELGISHVHLAFEDGGCPSVELILRFLEIVSTLDGAYAVHCRSGLGRTATLIGVYAIRYFGYTAQSFIGWARLMRPGTVHGSQQQYLVNLEQHVVPDAKVPLTALDQRERLLLLPRRELRFWALDSGIPAQYTRTSSEEEMVEMILQAHGVHVPMKVPPLVQPAFVHQALTARTPEASVSLQPAAVPRAAPMLCTLSNAEKSALNSTSVPSAQAGAAIPISAQPVAQQQIPCAQPMEIAAIRGSGGHVEVAQLAASVMKESAMTLASMSVDTTGSTRASGEPTGMHGDKTGASLGEAGLHGMQASSALDPALQGSAASENNGISSVAASQGLQAQAPLPVSTFASNRKSLFADAPQPALVALGVPSVGPVSDRGDVPTPLPVITAKSLLEQLPATAGGSATAKILGGNGGRFPFGGLNAAIDSLSRSARQKGPESLPADSLSGSTSSITAVDEWDEVLRYLHLLKAVQIKGGPSWDDVRMHIERLRCIQPDPRQAGPLGSLGAEAQAVQQVREARAAASHQAEARDAALKDALQQARELQRGCEQLKMRLSLEREDKTSERRRAAAREEAQASELKREEARLKHAASEVDELRRRLLRQGGLDQSQIERLEDIRNRISQAKASTERSRDQCNDLRAKLEISFDDSDSAAVAAAALPAMDGSSSAPADPDGPSWASVRRSIQRVRDQCRLAVQEAAVSRKPPPPSAAPLPA